MTPHPKLPDRTDARTEARAYYGGPAVREWHPPGRAGTRPQAADHHPELSAEAWRLFADIGYADRTHPQKES